MSGLLGTVEIGLVERKMKRMRAAGFGEMLNRCWFQAWVLVVLAGCGVGNILTPLIVYTLGKPL